MGLLPTAEPSLGVLQNGTKRTVKFTIKGEAKSPFLCEPEVLNFLPDEILKGTEKEVRILENGIPIKWSTVQITSSSPELRIVRKAIEGRSIRFGVRCVLPEDRESIQCTFSVSGRVSKQVPAIARTGVEHTISVVARQKVDLIILPRIIPIAYGTKSSKGTGRFLVRGDRVKGDKPLIKSITSPGHEIDWKMTKAGNDSAVVQLEVRQNSSQASVDNDFLVELVDDKKPVRLPTVAVKRE
jgi:hypothetical protein